ncbi:MAG TPA: thioredoxin [Spirochaetia bacterium]|nr:thioredoxin [Spirochaetia bacterium]
MAHEVTLTAENFDTEVLQSDVPVLIDFWAEWCGPCKMISPIVEELAGSYEGKLKVGKVNVDEEGDIASKYGIISIPTLLVFKNGDIVNKQVGAVPRPSIEALFKEFV